MDRQIKDIDFVIFDVETTGLNPGWGDRICEVGAVKFKDSRILKSFSSLINPEIPMPRAAFEVNHISDAMLKKAPLAKEIIPQFLNFIEGSNLVAYNARFDLAFLEKELKLLNLTLPKDILALDVLMMARRMLPELDSHALCFVAQALNFAQAQEHRALSDVEITAQIFRYLLYRIDEAGIKRFGDFFNMFGIHRELIDEMNTYKEAAILRAIDLGARLKIKYFTASTAKLSEREVTPHALKEEGGFKYLVGHCFLRKDNRTFKVDNITAIEMLK